MKKQLLLLFYILCSSIIQSQTFNDGILKYTVTNGTNVTVSRYFSCQTGILVIPNTIVDSGTTYTITSIKDYAFIGCTGLTDITIPNSVTSIGDYAFQGCTGLTSIAIPNSVTSIGNYTFQKSFGLTNITIPNSVTSIGYFAFQLCSGLTTISISNSVTNIGNAAFANCSSLTSVAVNWSIPLVVPSNIFQGAPVNTIPLTVPTGTVALYEVATVWQDFASIVLSTEDFTESVKTQLFPNPVHNQLNISINSDLSLQKVLIYNNLGQLMIESKESIIDVSNLQGIHFVQIVTDNGTVAKKIIVK